MAVTIKAIEMLAQGSCTTDALPPLLNDCMEDIAAWPMVRHRLLVAVMLGSPIGSRDHLSAALMLNDPAMVKQLNQWTGFSEDSLASALAVTTPTVLPLRPCFQLMGREETWLQVSADEPWAYDLVIASRCPAPLAVDAVEVVYQGGGGLQVKLQWKV